MNQCESTTVGSCCNLSLHCKNSGGHDVDTPIVDVADTLSASISWLECTKAASKGIKA
ncbi:hypothetical protein DPMN_040332 [Dreissena polymorpha]|uniref:Uncharacterized protein n=1 Tax=Dreissena polymorpha TaxID=45954 RepID=A0A9D4CXX9_DREPO|nr:hypothetical protein DPMN_040332 [Dreissena polymorpha]